MKKTINLRYLSTISLFVLVMVQLSACTAPAPLTSPTPATPPEKPTQPVPTRLPDGESTGKVLQSNLLRDLAPTVASEDLHSLVQGNSEFALDFYKQVRNEGGNIFYSPLSISLALVMTYAGARGETASQMAQTLRYLLPQERLHPAFNLLDLQLTAPTEAGEDQSQPFMLSIANSLWGEQTFSFLPEFLDLIAVNYGAGLRLLDFIDATEASRQVINNWIAEATRQKILDLIPEGSLDPDTRLVLANAIYFKADWVYQFLPNSTQELPFNLLDGTQKPVSMMHFNLPATLKYMAGNGFQAVELPYVGERASMLVLLPDPGLFTDFEASLDGDRLNDILGGLQERTVALTFPKFSFEQALSLSGTLKNMGMPAAFDPGAADFSAMDGQGQLYISAIFHKAFVAVDEQGTEAAAATSVIMAPTSIMEIEVNLLVDRPFIFLIIDREGGSILFVGRFVQP